MKLNINVIQIPKTTVEFQCLNCQDTLTTEFINELAGNVVKITCYRKREEMTDQSPDDICSDYTFVINPIIELLMYSTNIQDKWIVTGIPSEPSTQFAKIVTNTKAWLNVGPSTSVEPGFSLDWFATPEQARKVLELKAFL